MKLPNAAQWPNPSLVSDPSLAPGCLLLGPPVFENARVVVVEKPPGWLSVPSRIGAQDERPCVGRQLEVQLATRLWPVHRLDVEVPGLLVFAKDAAAHRLLCAGFESHQVRKTYLAWASGGLPADAVVGTTSRWESRLLRGKKRAYVHPSGKESVTLALPLLADGDAVLWQLSPLTGRPHQLRVELFLRGCPILGDALYGSQVPWADGIALCAVGLDFSSLAAQPELGLPPSLSLVSDDPVRSGIAWRKACASASGHSIHSACPADGISTGAG